MRTLPVNPSSLTLRNLAGFYLLAVFSTAGLAVASSGGLSPLSAQDFQSEVVRLTAELGASKRQAEAVERYWSLHTEKLRTLLARGFSRTVEVEDAAQKLTTARENVAALEAYSRVLAKAGTLGARLPRDENPPTRATIIRIPGATERFGGIEMFTLSAGLTRSTLNALGTQSQGQQAILTHQIEAASTMVDRLQEVAGSLEKVENVSEMESARLQIRVSKAETALEYWRQDLLSAEENQQVFQEGGGMSWNDDSAGLIGAGWRYAAPPTVEMVRLCLPIADAQRRADGRVKLLSVIVEEARYRLGLMEPLESSRNVHPWEVRQARLGLEQIEGLLAAEQGRLQVSELLYQRLLRAAKLDTFSPAAATAPDYARTGSSAVLALDALPQDGAWLYGLVRVTGNELLAVARCRSADDMVQHRRGVQAAYQKVKSVRELELKRAEFAVRRAEASALIAAQDYEVCHLASRQWLELAKAHRSASYLPDPWLNEELLSGGKEIVAARLEVEKKLLSSAEAGSRFQEERLAGYQGLKAGAASEYELEMARLRLMQREGEVASSLHRMTVMHHARDLVASGALDLQQSGLLGNVLDLSEKTRGKLAELAGELQGPNAGTLLQMRAVRGMTEMRSRKLDDLLTRGFASKRETADIRTQLTCLTSLLAAEEARGNVADSAREVIAGLFSEEAPKKPGEDVIMLPELR